MKVKLHTLTSKQAKEVTLPANLFGKEVKPAVLAQAVRVLKDRQHQTLAQAKTRGQIRLTTAKAYAQKHTGRARHGARSAPIFVGGGVAHGPKGLAPKPLRLTRKLRRLSILGAFNYLASNEAVALVDNLNKAKPKTGEVFRFAQSIAGDKKTLLLTNQNYPELQQAAKNIPNLTLMPATSVNALSLLKTKQLLVDNTALSSLEDWLLGSKSKVETKAKKPKAATKKAK